MREYGRMRKCVEVEGVKREIIEKEVGLCYERFGILWFVVIREEVFFFLLIF